MSTIYNPNLDTEIARIAEWLAHDRDQTFILASRPVMEAMEGKESGPVTVRADRLPNGLYELTFTKLDASHPSGPIAGGQDG